MQVVRASSVTAMPPQALSNSSSRVTSSCARSASMPRTEAALGVIFTSLSPRQSCPVLGSKRNEPNANCRSAAIRPVQSDFTEISQNFVRTLSSHDLSYRLERSEIERQRLRCNSSHYSPRGIPHEILLPHPSCACDSLYCW